MPLTVSSSCCSMRVSFSRGCGSCPRASVRPMNCFMTTGSSVLSVAKPLALETAQPALADWGSSTASCRSMVGMHCLLRACCHAVFSARAVGLRCMCGELQRVQQADCLGQGCSRAGPRGYEDPCFRPWLMRASLAMPLCTKPDNQTAASRYHHEPRLRQSCHHGGLEPARCWSTFSQRGPAIVRAQNACSQCVGATSRAYCALHHRATHHRAQGARWAAG
jgi:hypothetical protein